MSPAPVRVPLATLADDVPHRVDLGDDPVILLRRGMIVRAYAGACPHAGAPLEQGAVCGERLVCHWHKAVFALGDGSVLDPPALAPLARYATRIEGEDVVLTGARLGPLPPAPVADPPGTIAIIGAGAAASAAIAHLRARRIPSRIVLIGREDQPPYDRTVLSKMTVAGEMDDAPALLPDDALAPPVERITGEVVHLDAPARTLRLADGRTLAFDRALIATGGVAHRPDLPGAALPGIHLLRTAVDATALLADLAAARHVLLLGASFISLEVATGLRQRGIAATIVGSAEPPLAQLFGPAIGARLRQLHEEHGVRFVAGRIARFDGTDRIAAAILDDGTRLDTDTVVLGTGVRPEAGFARGVDITDGAVTTDATLHAGHGLYAAGDVARFPLRGEPTRIEHWRLAQQHGWLAARNMLGDEATFGGVPYLWTAQHGLRIDYLGHATEWDEIVVDGDLAALDFVAYVVKDGTVRAAIGSKRETATARLVEAMREELTLEEARDAVG